MITKQAALARKQLDRRLAPLRGTSFAVPRLGWIRAIRESLGMTTRQLASRMRLSQSRIPAIEDSEITGATTLRTLRQAAEALDCTFVYAFVPNKPLDDIVYERATRRARRELSRLNHTMLLENQALRKDDLDAEEQREVDRILSGTLRRLWDEESGSHP